MVTYRYQTWGDEYFAGWYSYSKEMGHTELQDFWFHSGVVNNILDVIVTSRTPSDLQIQFKKYYENSDEAYANSYDVGYPKTQFLSGDVSSISFTVQEKIFKSYSIIYYDGKTELNTVHQESVSDAHGYGVATYRPTKLGYTFQYWKDSAGNRIDTVFPNNFDSEYNVKLYAVWKSNAPATYTITYNANGGSGAPSSQTKTHNVTLTLSSTKPTRSGFNFLGWSTSSTATSPTYYAGGSYTANASATLYAVWSKIVTTYTIRFDANGGINAPSAQTKTHGTAIVLSTNVPTRSNYTFLGWSSNPSAFSIEYTAGSTYSNNSSVTLYAVWKLNLVEVEDFIYSRSPLSDASTGLTLATSKTICNKDVGVRLNYLDIIKLNNPANIIYGQSLFGIEGSYRGNIVAQSGIVIHDKTSTTIYPFYGSDSELSNIIWSVSSEGVAFNTGNRHHRFLNTNVTALVGLNGEPDILVGSSNNTYLTANVVKEYEVIYGEGSQPSEPETPTEQQEFIFDLRGSNGNQVYWLKITGTEAVVTWEDDGTTSGYNILKINGYEIANDAANSYAGLSVENDFNVTSSNDIKASTSPTTLTSGGTYTYYLYMTNEITN